MTQGQVETLNQTGTDRQPQLLQPLGPAAHAVDQRLQTSLALLFDHLAIDQIRMGLLACFLRASRLARARKGFQRMVSFDQSRQVTAEPITEKARDTPSHGRRHLDQLPGTVKRPWADKGRKDKTEFWGKTEPHPLPSVLAQLGAFAVRVGLLGMLAPDEAPHLIELHLGDRQVAKQVHIDLMRLLCGSPQPLQDGFFGHAPYEADIGKRDFDQQHLQGHHDLLFWGPQVKEDSITCLGEGTLTLATAEDASLATLGHISRNGTNVASVHQPIMGTVRVGARLAPVLGFSHRPILRSSGCVIHTDRMVGLFSFSKYYRVSTEHTPGGLIGRSVRRVEDPVLITGRGCYVDDIQLPSMLYMAFLRSPYPHATI